MRNNKKRSESRKYRDMGGEKMICTVTFNPSLDYIVSVEDFQLGLTNRTSSELMLPGGKGINVSTVLMNLGIGMKKCGNIQLKYSETWMYLFVN